MSTADDLSTTVVGSGSDQVRPPSVETFAPPSFDWIIVFPLFGLIQIS